MNSRDINLMTIHGHSPPTDLEIPVCDWWFLLVHVSDGPAGLKEDLQHLVTAQRRPLGLNGVHQTTP